MHGEHYLGSNGYYQQLTSSKQHKTVNLSSVECLACVTIGPGAVGLLRPNESDAEVRPCSLGVVGEKV